MAIPDAGLLLEGSRNSAVVHGGDNERLSGSALTGNAAGCDYVVTPKLKRRKVSAVRDFPPGCGRFAAQLNSGPTQGEDDAGLINREEDMADTSDALPINPEFGNGEMVGVDDENEKPGDLVNGHCIPSTEELDRERLVNTTEASQLEFSGVLPKTDIVPDVQNNVVESDESVVPLAIDSCVNSKTSRYPPRRRVSTIRDFPTFCGRNAPILMKEEGTSNTAALLKDGDLGEENPSKDGALQGNWPDDSKKDEDLGEEALQGSLPDDSKKDGDLGEENPSKEGALQGQWPDDSMKEDEILKLQDETGSGAGDSEIYVEPGSLAMVLWRNEDEPNGNPGVRMAEEDALHSFAGSPVGGNQKLSPIVEDTADDRNSDFEDSGKPTANEDVKGDERAVEEDKPEDLSQRKIVLGIMASPNSRWKRMKKGSENLLQDDWTKSEGEKLKELSKSHSGKKKNTEESSRYNSTKGIILHEEPSTDEGMGQMVVWEAEDSSEADVDTDNFYVAARPRKLSVNPPRLVPDCLGSEVDNGTQPVTRNKVRETLRLFQTICRRLLQEEETKSKHENRRKRVDLPAAKIMREKGKIVNTGKPILGVVPGVEVGDEFQYRVELNVIGLHRAIQGGIDYVKHDDKILATSVVSSGAYEDVLEHTDFLIYTGQGGNVVDKDKEPEDQKLEKGNLALFNSMDEKTPVRVIRGLKEKRASLTSDSKNKVSTLYTYDGLYMVDRLWQEVGQHGKLVFKFQLNRIPGQPELAWKVVNKSKSSETREGLCMRDISQGKERMPIGAVNTIDDENPPQFTYVTKVIYPNWCRRLPPAGCNCSKRCSDSVRCYCAVKNGGEIPYNHDGAIVDAKPLVYECGPSCKCPPSCHNRVSQHGIKIPLEIFKTESRGWGVRSLASISSGGFICEYIGELLDDKQADQMTGNDEYLFDIGNDYNDFNINMHEELSDVMPDGHSVSVESVEEGGFTIDALKYGNVGRFINHSCSPNLYAQNVLYDHDDKRIPHIMLFAAENIPPLQELTYHYNYIIDQVRDSEGNIKKKSCFCGSPECTGRMY